MAICYVLLFSLSILFFCLPLLSPLIANSGLIQWRLLILSFCSLLFSLFLCLPHLFIFHLFFLAFILHPPFPIISNFFSSHLLSHILLLSFFPLLSFSLWSIPLLSLSLSFPPLSHFLSSPPPLLSFPHLSLSFSPSSSSLPSPSLSALLFSSPFPSPFPFSLLPSPLPFSPLSALFLRLSLCSTALPLHYTPITP